MEKSQYLLDLFQLKKLTLKVKGYPVVTFVSLRYLLNESLSPPCGRKCAMRMHLLYTNRVSVIFRVSGQSMFTEELCQPRLVCQ